MPDIRGKGRCQRVPADSCVEVDMAEYEFRGTFTFIVDAENREVAEQQLEEQLGAVLLSWQVEAIAGD